MKPTRKLIQIKNIDLVNDDALTNHTIFTPFNGLQFIVTGVFARTRARTGTITEARILLESGDSTAIVASVIPVAGTSAVGDIKQHTIATANPQVTYSAPLKLTTVAEATATVAKIDLFIEGLLVNN
jgi:hypothetical protein